MTIEVAHHPQFLKYGTFEHLRLGRNKTEPRPKNLQLKNYVDLSQITTPDTVDYVSDVPSWPMYGNDSLGDCTCAAVGHMIQAWSAKAGTEKTPQESDIETLYWETGYPPSTSGTAGGPTDDGRDEQGVLSYWRNTGVAGDKITAWAMLDASNLDLLKAAMYLFGGVYTGIGLPLTAQGQSIWDVVPATPDKNEPYTWGGHAVPYLGYDESGFVCITWGAPLRLTTAFHNEYTDEAYALISSDWLDSINQTSPQGFDLEALEADLSQVTQQ